MRVQRFTGLGLVPSTTEAADETVPAGSVISQDPAAGTAVAAGSAVNIVVSTGPDAPGTVPVPDVAGQPEGDAQKTLVDADSQSPRHSNRAQTLRLGSSSRRTLPPGTEVHLTHRLR